MRHLVLALLLSAAPQQALGQGPVNYAGFTGEPGQKVFIEIASQKGNDISGTISFVSDKAQWKESFTGGRAGTACVLETQNHIMVMGLCDEDGFVGDLAGQLAGGQIERDSFDAAVWNGKADWKNSPQRFAGRKRDLQACRNSIQAAGPFADGKSFAGALDQLGAWQTRRDQLSALLKQRIEAYVKVLPTQYEFNQIQLNDANLQRMAARGPQGMAEAQRIQQAQLQAFNAANGRPQAVQDIRKIDAALLAAGQVAPFSRIVADIGTEKARYRQTIVATLQSLPTNADSFERFHMIEGALAALSKCLDTSETDVKADAATLSQWVAAASGPLLARRGATPGEQKGWFDRLRQSPSFMADAAARASLSRVEAELMAKAVPTRPAVKSADVAGGVLPVPKIQSPVLFEISDGKRWGERFVLFRYGPCYGDKSLYFTSNGGFMPTCNGIDERYDLDAKTSTAQIRQEASTGTVTLSGKSFPVKSLGYAQITTAQADDLNAILRRSEFGSYAGPNPSDLELELARAFFLGYPQHAKLVSFGVLTQPTAVPTGGHEVKWNAASPMPSVDAITEALFRSKLREEKYHFYVNAADWSPCKPVGAAFDCTMSFFVDADVADAVENFARIGVGLVQGRGAEMEIQESMKMWEDGVRGPDYRNFDWSPPVVVRFQKVAGQWQSGLLRQAMAEFAAKTDAERISMLKRRAAALSRGAQSATKTQCKALAAGDFWSGQSGLTNSMWFQMNC